MNHRLTTAAAIALPTLLALTVYQSGTAVPDSAARLRDSGDGQISPAYPPAMGGPDIVQPAPPGQADARTEADLSARLRLTSLAQQSKSRPRLQAADVALLSDVLSSGDPVLLLAGTDALLAHLDDGSPDSRLRARAFGYAAKLHAAELAPVLDHGSCVHTAQCFNEYASQYDTTAPRTARERVEVERLVKRYRAALQTRASAAELLAIR